MEYRIFAKLLISSSIHCIFKIPTFKLFNSLQKPKIRLIFKSFSSSVTESPLPHPVIQCAPEPSHELLLVKT